MYELIGRKEIVSCVSQGRRSSSGNTHQYKCRGVYCQLHSEAKRISRISPLYPTKSIAIDGTMSSTRSRNAYQKPSTAVQCDSQPGALTLRHDGRLSGVREPFLQSTVVVVHAKTNLANDSSSWYPRFSGFQYILNERGIVIRLDRR